MTTPYLMAVRNCAAYIRSQSKDDLERHPDRTLDAFEAARVLAIAFAKLPEDVLNDLLTIDVPGFPPLVKKPRVPAGLKSVVASPAMARRFLR